MLTSNQKGAVAETAVAHAAVKIGIDVYRPVAEGGRCDLIFDFGQRLIRVQCKWAERRGEVIPVRCYSSRRARDGFLKRSYTAEEVDAIVAYCAELDRCFFLAVDLFACRTYVQLRLSPSRNNQKRGVNWADDYAFESLDWNTVFQGP
jgi:PD-(D/E)XK nuclease superfamily protein